MKLTAQKHYFGCGFACLASLLEIEYIQAFNLIEGGEQKAVGSGLLCREVVTILQQQGFINSHYKYLKPRLKRTIYHDGTIVFIKRSKRFPVGHYLIRAEGQWMDPWINFQQNNDAFLAQSGFRKRLPSTPIFAIYAK
jgi:hypothetical protein